jgi:hypothetical protein
MTELSTFCSLSQRFRKTNTSSVILTKHCPVQQGMAGCAYQSYSSGKVLRPFACATGRGHVDMLQFLKGMVRTSKNKGKVIQEAAAHPMDHWSVLRSLLRNVVTRFGVPRVQVLVNQQRASKASNLDNEEAPLYCIALWLRHCCYSGLNSFGGKAG